MKKPLLIVGGIIVLLLLIVLCLPLFINANQFKPTIESKLGTALGRQVTIRTSPSPTIRLSASRPFLPRNL
jgi:uncharacterized protein involved in outer membrane biogenesis